MLTQVFGYLNGKKTAYGVIGFALTEALGIPIGASEVTEAVEQINNIANHGAGILAAVGVLHKIVKGDLK